MRLNVTMWHVHPSRPICLDNAYSVLDILTSIIRLNHALTSLFGIGIYDKLLVALSLPLTGTSYQLAVAERDIDDELKFTKPIMCCLHVLRALWCVGQCAIRW